ncbi:DUF1566 domain-containing protein [Flavobacterium sp. J27]|uniref:Lcl C-terminal domain-containing protein n=1 Tax=Flavobacterium sp. J27 TaxID=2060419 RepID=UPI0010305B99|nr:DUF1566 domain-containing protein [Flavobacterium sp. J27]
MPRTLIYFVTIIGLINSSCDNRKTSAKPKNELQNVINTDSIVKKSQPNIDSTLIVVDSSSNLIWMKKDFGIIKQRYLRDWEEIFQWKDKLNSENYAGFSDWRVPTIKEYRSINQSKEDRKLYREQFEELDTSNVWGNGAYAFWSKTTPNKNTSSYISFIDGFATSGSRGKQMATGPWKGIEFGMSVRLVRDIDSL